MSLKRLNKKTGTEFRKERAKKAKLQNEVLEKTPTLQTFFEKKLSVTLPPVSSTENVDSIVVPNLSSSENFHVHYHESLHKKSTEDVVTSSSPTNSVVITSTTETDPSNCVHGENPCNDKFELEFGVYEIVDDPSKWNLNNAGFIDYFVTHPINQDLIKLDFSKSKVWSASDNYYRNISYSLFFKNKMNGERVRRAWMYYSESAGKLFCIYCKLFSHNPGTFNDVGFNDWKHTNLIYQHETTKSHCEAAVKRSVEVGNLKSLLTKQINDEVQYWKDVLKRVFSVVSFLASRGLPFRGSNQHIGCVSNGNFLGIMEVIAEYDYSNSAETVLDDRSKFRVNSYYSVLDFILSDLQERVTSYEKDVMPFNFLRKLESLADETIRVEAEKLWTIYQSDIDKSICDECVQFKFFLQDIQDVQEVQIHDVKEEHVINTNSDTSSDSDDDQSENVRHKKEKKVSKTSKMLQFVKNNSLEATFPNIEVILRIFECLTVCNATGERSFNALKRVKNFQRSTIGQENLNDLFIESDILKQVNVEDTIGKFANIKARKKMLN